MKKHQGLDLKGCRLFNIPMFNTNMPIVVFSFDATKASYIFLYPFDKRKYKILITATAKYMMMLLFH